MTCVAEVLISPVERDFRIGIVGNSKFMGSDNVVMAPKADRPPSLMSGNGQHHATSLERKMADAWLWTEYVLPSVITKEDA